RNLALKQYTIQSSTLNPVKSKSSNAVDGNIDNEYDHNSCTHTNNTEKATLPFWRVHFKAAILANRFVLYNR
ncbi:hypothetical protein BgiMline_035974, partial [Biomphalaria glabrata]